MFDLCKRNDRFLLEGDSAVLPSSDWHVHYALFSRSGFTKQLQTQADNEGVWLVGLSEIAGKE